MPSLDLRSRASSTQYLPNSLATVTSDGTVSWHRLGPLNAICSYVGLPRMSFDELGCRFYFGDNDINTVVSYKLADLGNNLTKGFQYVAVKEKTDDTYYDLYSHFIFLFDSYFSAFNQSNLSGIWLITIS